jgi:mRNA-degrading endonuclease YafQ of YafQ-DinJ toxin-antitoxin module
MFEVSRYNFNYSIDKSKHKYSLPDIEKILKNKEDSYSLRQIYRNHILYKNFTKNLSKPSIVFDNILIKQYVSTNNILYIQFDLDFYKNL